MRGAVPSASKTGERTSSSTGSATVMPSKAEAGSAIATTRPAARPRRSTTEAPRREASRPTTNRPRRCDTAISATGGFAIFSLPRDLLVAHAEAVVGDRSRSTPCPVTPRQTTTRVLGVGEVGGVLEDLGEQMRDGQCVRGRRRRGLGHRRVDAVERLDLADGRTDDVGQRQRVAQASGRVDAGQHEQALRVAAHPGGQVVELEEAVEDVRVLLAGLHLVQLASWRPSSTWLRRATLTNISAMLARSAACSFATCT